MTHDRIRTFNTRDVYPGATLDNDLAMVVRAGHRIFMRGQTGLDLDQRMHAPEDAAAQADQAMRNVAQLLEEAGSSLEHVCKVTTYLTDRAYRVPVYNVVGGHLKGIPTVATGLIVKGLAMPEMKVELDIEAVIPDAAGHRRFRTFNTGNWFGQSSIDRESCMAIRTRDEIYLRGQTGAELDGSRFHGLGHGVADAAAQADQAMKNARTLLEEAGSSFDDVCKMRVYIGDRAYREAVYNVLGAPAGVVSVTRVRPGEESDRSATKDMADITAREVELGSAGLPVGVQVVARYWQEDVVLAVMAALEDHFRGTPDYPARPD